jgi:hypothetical protein
MIILVKNSPGYHPCSALGFARAEPRRREIITGHRGVDVVEVKVIGNEGV